MCDFEAMNSFEASLLTIVFLRVWTGFQPSNYRGNLEYFHYGNYVDPMKLNSQLHDSFPKANILGGYLGDSYPLCEDFPAQSFLRTVHRLHCVCIISLIKTGKALRCQCCLRVPNSGILVTNSRAQHHLRFPRVDLTFFYQLVHHYIRSSAKHRMATAHSHRRPSLRCTVHLLRSVKAMSLIIFRCRLFSRQS